MLAENMTKVLFLFKKVGQDIGLFFSAGWGVLCLIFRAGGKGHLRGVLKHFRRVMHENLTRVEVFIRASAEFGDLNSRSLQTLRQRAKGLHSLLPDATNFNYSILVPVDHSKPIHPKFFAQAIYSAMNQSAPFGEVLVGLDGKQGSEIDRVLSELSQIASTEKSTYQLKLRILSFPGYDYIGLTNALAKESQGNFLLLMDPEGWAAPDLLFRYEQCLRLHTDPARVVLYCNEYQLNHRDEPVLDSAIIKPEYPLFPYVFSDFTNGRGGLLVSKALWESAQGLHPEYLGARTLDFCLRLDLQGAVFQNIPFPLIAYRTLKVTETEAGVRALKKYVSAKALNWEISEGNFQGTFRAKPALQTHHCVHVIIPYKNQKALTLLAASSVLAQSEGLKVMITAVDNCSDDLSIRLELEALGVEVLRLDEPFNYSRINNSAVKNSKFASSVDCVLFLNNDVELKSGALHEMLRWIDQPQIGMVGARLLFPSGKVQHGGVMLRRGGSSDRMVWSHVDINLPAEHLGPSQALSICDAVTAACVLIKQSTFLEVGGFDEIWYPIAFSDTDLAMRLRRKGLYCLYTPYALGTHYESASRGPGVYELPEGSQWLYEVTRNRSTPVEKLPSILN